MKIKPQQAGCRARFALLASIAVLSGSCVSANKEPTVEVKAARNPAAPNRAQKTYAITCSNALVQQWFVSDREALIALDDALQKLGYEEAADPALATYQIVAELGFGRRPVVQPVENPDSIRYQNVAAMVGQGRYSQILTERHDSGGSLLMGPTGEIIPTGGWRKIMEDSEPKDVKETGTHDALILRAWDVADRDKHAMILAWEVMVRRTIDYRMPSPKHVGLMIREAAERLSAGWPDVSSAELDGKAPPAPSAGQPPETAAGRDSANRP